MVDPFAFLVMLIVSFITSATTTNLKKQARILAEREKELAAAENEKCVQICCEPSLMTCARL